MSHHHRKSRSSKHEPNVDNQDSNSSSSTGIINIITSKKQGINTFANDGSFLETYKRLMEEEAKVETSGTSDGEGSKSADEKLKRKIDSAVKRRKNKVLKTGMVKKQKLEDSNEELPPTSDAWTRYMAEVKKYRQQACDEDGKTRPLVK